MKTFKQLINEFNQIQLNDIQEEGVKQDPDIKDKEGTQPAKYFKGLSKSTKEKRDAHFKKGKKKHWSDSSAYKPAPGDDVETKESKYTKAMKKKYPDLYKEEVLDEGKADSSISKKAEKSGISAEILRQVYNRGVAAWRTGHRPGTTPEQWGHARVNSFITGGKTRTSADADLWKKHKSINEAKDPVEYDQEGRMAKNQLKIMIDAAQELHDMMGDNDNLPEWVQNKITRATDYIDSVRDYLKAKNENI